MKLSAMILLSLILPLACSNSEKADESEQESVALEPAAVEVTAVRRGPIDDVLTVRGETQALKIVRLASPVAGRVTFLAAQPGDRVRAGEAVFRVIPLESEAAVQGFTVLRESGKLGSEAVESSRRLEDEVRSHEIAVRAPFAAFILSRSRNPGEQVAAGDVVIELFDPRSLVVIAQVPTRVTGRLSTGAPVDGSISDRRFSGRVAAILPAVTPDALTVPVRVVLDVPPDPPLVGAAVTCRITVSHHPDSLLVPPSALLTPPSAGRALVFVMNQAGKAERREVTVGLHGDSDEEVLQGLAEGDLVLSSGQYGLADGAPIRIETPPPAASSAETPEPPGER
jgi:multidrug efflux pump subunit AcrA (membrane-fusion protein)